MFVGTMVRLSGIGDPDNPPPNNPETMDSLDQWFGSLEWSDSQSLHLEYSLDQWFDPKVWPTRMIRPNLEYFYSVQKQTLKSKTNQTKESNTIHKPWSGLYMVSQFTKAN